MNALQRIGWNERTRESVAIGSVLLAITAIACLALRRSSYRLRPESRLFLRDLAVITSTFSAIAFVVAYRRLTPQVELEEIVIDYDKLNNKETFLDQIPLNEIPNDEFFVWRDHGFDKRELRKFYGGLDKSWYFPYNTYSQTPLSQAEMAMIRRELELER